jgi:hypothetical protein
VKNQAASGRRDRTCTKDKVIETQKGEHRVWKKEGPELYTLENLGPRRSNGTVLKIKANGPRARCPRDCEGSR